MRPLFVVSLLLLAACSNDKTIIKPEEKPLIEAVYASGTAVARNQYEVHSLADGYVLQKAVEDGSSVKKGDPVYVLDNQQQSSRLALAQKNYSVALENYNNNSAVLKEAHAALQSTKSKMAFDSVNYVRYKNLLDRNATSRAEYDRIKLAYENSRNDFLLQESRYRKIRNQLYLELENAKSQLQVAGDESGRFVVKSDVNGIVFKTMKERGELVRRGEAVAIIGEALEYYLQLQVDELDINRVKKGQEVLVDIDAFPGKTFRAKIDKVYPMINAEQQSVRVDATLQDSLPQFYSGLAVEANIIIQRKDKTLVIAKKALVGADSVVLNTKDGWNKKKVRTGIQTMDEVEVLEGLTTESELAVK